MPLQQTSGNSTTDAYGGGVAVVPTYIEQIFSTYLYTGNGSTQTITNGIDLAGKGGLVWVKGRSDATTNVLVDTNRFVSSSNIQCLFSNSTDAASASANEFGSFNSNGFSIPYNTTAGWTNFGTRTFTSWTFRKQPKFFDVVTYTGNGADRSIAHSLGSVPGCIIVKCTSAATNWAVYHRSLTIPESLILNDTDAAVSDSANFTNTAPNSTQFNVGTTSRVNTTGATYVAYLFAHNAGGFGATGTDNVISCGSYTGNGSTTGPVVTLGYEPQWLMVKIATAEAVGNWYIVDNMRGFPVGSNVKVLNPNTSSGETEALAKGFFPTPTGFGVGASYGAINASGATVVYIAIRRGPMKVPTDGTKVFKPIAYSGTGTTTINTLNTTFPVDFYLFRSRSTDSHPRVGSRLTGNPQFLLTATTNAELTLGGGNGVNNDVGFASNVGIGVTGDWNNPISPDYSPYILEAFKRAPGFFDEVCYTGDYAGNPQIPHNLGVVPELIIAKNRGATATQWYIHHASLGASQVVYFTADPAQSGDLWTRTSTYWKNASANYPTGEAHVAYLFATCPGVSKVGSYTGTGATQTINCGFAAGARFVLIKRTDSTGDWYVWDTARGMVAGTDPKLALNTTAAESNANWVYTATTGFQIVTADASVNASGGSYIFLAIS